MKKSIIAVTNSSAARKFILHVIHNVHKLVSFSHYIHNISPLRNNIMISLFLLIKMLSSWNIFHQVCIRFGKIYNNHLITWLENINKHTVFIFCLTIIIIRYWQVWLQPILMLKQKLERSSICRKTRRKIFCIYFQQQEDSFTQWVSDDSFHHYFNFTFW